MPETPDRRSWSSRLSVRWLWIAVGLSVGAAVANAVGGPFRIAFTAVVILIALFLAVRLMPAPIMRALGRLGGVIAGISAACLSWSWRWRWWILPVVIVLAAFLPVRRAVLMHHVNGQSRMLVERGWLLTAEELAEVPAPSTENEQFARAFDRLWYRLNPSGDLSRYQELDEFQDLLESGIDLEANLAVAEEMLADARPALDEVAQLLRRFPEGALSDDANWQLYHVLALAKIDALVAAHRGDSARTARSLATGLRLFLANGRSSKHSRSYFLYHFELYAATVKQVLATTDLRDEHLAEIQQLYEAAGNIPTHQSDQKCWASAHWQALRQARYEPDAETSLVILWKRFWWWIWHKPIEQQRFLDAWESRWELLTAIAGKQPNTVALEMRRDAAFKRLESLQWPSEIMVYAYAYFDPSTDVEEILLADCLPPLSATAIAVERYRAAHGCWPESLSELVPTYLAKIPDDPLLPIPLSYRRMDHGFSIYTLGSNRQDDGGRLNFDQHEFSWHRWRDFAWCSATDPWAVPGEHTSVPGDEALFGTMSPLLRGSSYSSQDEEAESLELQIEQTVDMQGRVTLSGTTNLDPGEVLVGALAVTELRPWGDMDQMMTVQRLSPVAVDDDGRFEFSPSDPLAAGWYYAEVVADRSLKTKANRDRVGHLTIDLLADPIFLGEPNQQSGPILGGGTWLMVGRPVPAGENGWRIMFPPARVHQRASRGAFGRVQRREAVLSADYHVFYFAWERLPDGYTDQRGIERVLLDAFDPIRRPDEKIESLTWQGHPAVRLDRLSGDSATSGVETIGLSIVADQYRYTAIALAWYRQANRRLMDVFVSSLRPDASAER